MVHCPWILGIGHTEMSRNIRGQKLTLAPGRGGVLGKTWEMHRVILVPSKPSLTLLHETLVLSPWFMLRHGGAVLLLLGLAPPAPMPPCPRPGLSGGYRSQNMNKWTEPADHDPGLGKIQQFLIKKVFLHYFWVFSFFGVTMSSLFLQLHLCLNQGRGAHTRPTRVGTLKTNKGQVFSYLKKKKTRKPLFLNPDYSEGWGFKRGTRRGFPKLAVIQCEFVIWRPSNGDNTV